MTVTTSSLLGVRIMRSCAYLLFLLTHTVGFVSKAGNIAETVEDRAKVSRSECLP